MKNKLSKNQIEEISFNVIEKLICEKKITLNKGISAKKISNLLNKIYKIKVQKQITQKFIPIMMQFHEDATNMLMKGLNLPEEQRTWAQRMVAGEMAEWGFRDDLVAIANDITDTIKEKVGYYDSDNSDSPDINYKNNR